jgi:hypothetical protein
LAVHIWLPTSHGPPRHPMIFKPEYYGVKRAIAKMKNSKATGVVDGIVAEALKADTDSTAGALKKLYDKVWDEKRVPEDWK